MQKRFIIKVWGTINEFTSIEELNVHDKVVVDNGGLFVGCVLGVANNEEKEELPMILRKATQKDIEQKIENEKLAKEVFKKAKKICREYNEDMKIVSSEFSLDRQKLVLSFSSENRVDFRDLVKNLATTFKTRIELKQIGARDETKIVGGLGPCGLPCCCKKCLSEIPFTGIKMAKNQNLSLSPQKLNGLCGKIMCCVSYENDYYADTIKKMPKVNSFVGTKNGKGQVLSCNILKQTVLVKTGNERDGFDEKEYALSDIKFDANGKN